MAIKPVMRPEWGALPAVGGSERAWRQLLSATPLEAPAASGMRINIRSEDSSLVVVGEPDIQL